MKNICNHMIFLDADARNNLHEGKEVEGQGYATIIDMQIKNLDFSVVNEFVTKYKISSTSKKSEISAKPRFLDDINDENFIFLNFNPKKLKIDMDEILDIGNEGKEKINFTIMDKDSISYIAISDISTLKNNYVFMDEINSFSEQEKI